MGRDPGLVKWRRGTFGLSYPGAVQWMAAGENPPHLKAMVPAMTFASQENFIYARGPFDMSWIEWVWNDIAPDRRARRHLAGPSNHDEALAAWSSEGPRMESVLPLQGMDAFRAVAPFYYEWLRHPPEDAWWAWADLRPKYGRTQAAVLNLSGWYDEGYGPEGATENFADFWPPVLVRPRMWRCFWDRGSMAWMTPLVRSPGNVASPTMPRSTTTAWSSIGWITTCAAWPTTWAAAATRFATT